jgi:O-antigen/teichoic acid export membrane protein
MGARVTVLQLQANPAIDDQPRLRAPQNPPRTPPPPSPPDAWRPLVRDSLWVGSSTAVCHALGLVTSLVLRACIGPAEMGVWQALKLFLSYGNYFNLGISKGAAREWSLALGRGETRQAVRGLHLAFTVNTLTSGLYAIGLLGAAAWWSTAGDGPCRGLWAFGLAVLAVLVVLQRHVTFHVTILRAGQNFAVTSRLAIFEAAATLVLGGTAAWCWGVEGLYCGTSLVLLGSWAFLKLSGARRLNWAWDGPEIRRLIGIGGPILLTGVVTTLFRSLDRLMILGYASDREFQLGCYSLALLVSTQLYGLATMLAIVIGPRFTAMFGASGSRGAVAEFAVRTSELQAAVLALPAALSLVAGPTLLGAMFPDYGPGLAALAWIVPGSLALGLSLPASQYLVAVCQERRALATIIFGTIVLAAGNHFALSRDGGLAGVAAATALSYIAYSLLTIAVSLWPQLGEAARRRYVGGHVLVLAPTVGLAICLSGPPGGAAAAAWKTAAVVLVWSMTVFGGWHWGGWKALLSNRGRA